MKSLILCCLLIVSVQSAHAQLSSACRGGEMGRGDGLTDEQKRDLEKRCANALNAESHRTVKAVGMDDSDCLSQANYRADQQAYDVISSCNSQAQGLAYCSVVARHIVQYPTYISTIFGRGEYDERKSNEETCRATSIARAESDAVSSCRSEYGVSCDISSRGVVNDHHTKTRRRYVIMGPKEEYQICSASAAAAPDSRYRVQCSVEIVARAHR
ncbi:hypothetical protein [Bdellovibrio svalbardensis]|uniref:DUF4189 domain-containing protein n=1 Tax=Bdellovibrio svalbardensis TaxID=2972972 RepID=A0ABT6DNG2_9BACT|nr:hypothetical protein [Bdellovibrio svalbardensis]MDG0817640.1 hypothetical protein [Bdellovibrio svalbardensis]